MNKKYSLLFLLFISLFFLAELNAQSRRAIQWREHPTGRGNNQRYFAVGGYLAAMNYLGDLAPHYRAGSTSIPLTRPGLGITGIMRWHRQLSLRGSFLWGRLRGDDATADMYHEDDKFRYTRNLHFRNDIKEFSLDLLLDLGWHHRTFASRRKFIPYLFAGVAIFHHNPKAKVPDVDALHYELGNAQPIQQMDPRYAGVTPGEWIDLKPIGTEGQHLPGSEVKPYKNWNFAIPMGFGLRYRISRHYDFTFEMGYRKLFMDYLDDVSGVYVNPDEFGEGPEANLARLMADRSKEPVHAVSGDPRNLEYILSQGHTMGRYGQVPEEFGGKPYHLINGYGRVQIDNIRGKDMVDAYVVTKFTVTYLFGSGFGYSRTIGRGKN